VAITTCVSTDVVWADFQFNPDSHYLLECIQGDLLHDPGKKTMKLFTQLPDVFFMQIKFYKYDFKQDKMTTVRPPYDTTLLNGIS
jgi:hypothetical protein